MNQNIITYLNENKEKYSKDALIAELKKAGYAQGDIAEGIAQVFGGAVPSPVTVNTSFWNFKDKRVYTKASEKWADFLFGVFVPMIVGLVLSPVSFFLRGTLSVLGILMLCLWIIVLIRLFKCRRMMFYGLLTAVVFIPIIFILFIIVMYSSHGF